MHGALLLKVWIRFLHIRRYLPQSRLAKLRQHLFKKTGTVEDAPRDEVAWATAKKFEASFIAQMLNHSGLAKALTAAGGEDVASFSQFYMESIAEDITEDGGFGIAEKIYNYIEKKGGDYGDLGRL